MTNCCTFVQHVCSGARFSRACPAVRCATLHSAPVLEGVMRDLLLGIDIGTGSTKAVLATAEGAIVRTASRSHQMSLPRPGWAEMDPDAVWWTEVADLSRELLDGVDGQVAGVAVSGLGPCLLVTDSRDEPLRPACASGTEMRASQAIAELQREFSADRVLSRCGSAISTQAVCP